MLLTFIAFPSHFHDLVFLRTPWVVEIGLRNLLLLTALALAIRELAVERCPHQLRSACQIRFRCCQRRPRSPRPGLAFEVIQVLRGKDSRSGTPWYCC